MAAPRCHYLRLPKPLPCAPDPTAPASLPRRSLRRREHRNGGMQQHHHHQGATSGAGGPSASNPQSTTAGDLLLPVGAMSQLPAMSNGGLSGLSFML